jgi:5-amino-6-(5-phosphoribosylamino)uracil reductase
MSLDGRIDDCSGRRLMLSNDADLDRVDEVRAGCDAILVGAGTVRRDNPRLALRSPRRRQARVAAGQPPTPTKVTLTRRGDLDPQARFFTTEPGIVKVVYCPDAVAPELRSRLGPAPGPARGTAGPAAEVVPAGPAVELPTVLADLARRGIGRLLVEGGTTVHTAFLTAGLVDELQLVLAPFFVGEADAPRFVGSGSFPWDAAHPLTLVEARSLGDVVLLRYRAG